MNSKPPAIYLLVQQMLLVLKLLELVLPQLLLLKEENMVVL
jgi:hypothetical protein